jgi:hypothetical protein
MQVELIVGETNNLSGESWEVVNSLLRHGFSGVFH